MRLARYTIGARIFGAFAVMSAIIGLMGLAGYGVLSAAGNIAVITFDGPLMAINYARAAQTDFTEMQLAEYRFEHAAPADRPAIAAEIAVLGQTFDQDLQSCRATQPGSGRTAGDCGNTAADAALAARCAKKATRRSCRSWIARSTRNSTC